MVKGKLVMKQVFSETQTYIIWAANSVLYAECSSQYDCSCQRCRVETYFIETFLHDRGLCGNIQFGYYMTSDLMLDRLQRAFK